MFFNQESIWDSATNIAEVAVGALDKMGRFQSYDLHNQSSLLSCSISCMEKRIKTPITLVTPYFNFIDIVDVSSPAIIDPISHSLALEWIDKQFGSKYI